MRMLNQYSFLLLSIIIVLGGAVLIFRHGFHWQQLGLVGLLALAIILLWVVVRPKPGTTADSDEILRQIGNGIPVLIEVQSPY